ncbi:MAG: hypothetical protein Q4P13_07375 [Psychrobacter sp.]|nr:hypothetical protein [Psychrobacter sp.]
MTTIKNFLAALGLMTLLALAMSLASTGVDRISAAFDRYQRGQSAMIEMHKLSVPHDNHVDEYFY